MKRRTNADLQQQIAETQHHLVNAKAAATSALADAAALRRQLAFERERQHTRGEVAGVRVYRAVAEPDTPTCVYGPQSDDGLCAVLYLNEGAILGVEVVNQHGDTVARVGWLPADHVSAELAFARRHP